MQRILPPKLKKGDTIGLAAPCYVIKREKIEKVTQPLESMGYRVKLSSHLFSDAFEYAGSLEERIQDFNDLITDPEVNAILFGGGEVGNELLPYINYEHLAAHPKLMISYSDGTSILNAVHSQTGLVTFYGASPRTFLDAEPYNMRSFEKRVASLDCTYEKSGEWRVIHPGKCEGTLTGGYLINYASLFGTPYFSLSDDKPYVLFAEDHKIFSQPAVVSKWFSNLEMYGGMKNVKGLILGHYADEEYPVIDDILRRIGEKHQIPVVRCEDYGHGRYNSVLPIGIPCSLDTETGAFELLEPAVADV